MIYVFKSYGLINVYIKVEIILDQEVTFKKLPNTWFIIYYFILLHNMIMEYRYSY